MLTYQEGQIQHIRSKGHDAMGVSLSIQKEYLNHPIVSGNKWWKLKYNLENAKASGFTTVLTFGGAYSNHIFATAAACREVGLKSIGVIRGEETLPLNKTLGFAVSQEMKLHYVTRADYTHKDDAEFIRSLIERFGEFYLIPEGGTNELAVRGCAEFAEKLAHEKFDYVCLPVGTGGTMAGLIRGFNGSGRVVGFPVLKGGSFLNEEIVTLLNGSTYSNWSLMCDYHFGGYAKTSIELESFIKVFQSEHTLPLEPVYTGKMLYGIEDLIRKGFFKRGSSILAVHTGGLQIIP